MDIGELTVAAERLWRGEDWSGDGIGRPIAFVDLDRAASLPESLALPPCPVIGLGDAGHPLAAHLDAVIEPTIGAGAIARQVMAHPRAAAVIVQLLRLLPALSTEEGLTAESLAYAVLQGSDEHLRWRAVQPVPTPRGEGRLRVERGDDGLTLTLASPENGNAIDRPLRDALYEALSLAALDPDVARIALRAEGKAFSLGAELGEFGTTTDPATAHAIRLATLPARPAARCADRLEVHIQGACVGAGLELAAWARRIVATQNAWFQLPELAMGVLPGAGGCVSLTRRIGRQRTALLILSGKRLSAKQALDWGLVDELA
ncbi:MAG: enoyl-CoA hydratase/isomerase family protein [Novosphingobium sp.]|nr:MAG: enoyl-CoA hydratase/isomerase family protein [Novosphingobium sp.]